MCFLSKFAGDSPPFKPSLPFHSWKVLVLDIPDLGSGFCHKSGHILASPSTDMGFTLLRCPHWELLISVSGAAFPGGSDGKASVYNVGDLGLIPGWGRFPGWGNGNPLQYSCLENLTDGEAWCRLLSMGSQRVGHKWATSLHFFTFLFPYFHQYGFMTNIFPSCHFLSDSGRSKSTCWCLLCCLTWKFHSGLFLPSVWLFCPL